MTTQVPKIAQFGQQTYLSDPGMQRLLGQLKPFDAKDVIAKAQMDAQGAAEAGAASLSAVALPKITQIEHDTARFEIREINGHLVYYVELRRRMTPDRFLSEVVKPTFGPLWESRDQKVEGWCDSEESTKCGMVVGLWLHDFVLDAVNRSYFLERIPKDIATRIATATAE